MKQIGNRPQNPEHPYPVFKTGDRVAVHYESEIEPGTVVAVKNGFGRSSWGRKGVTGIVHMAGAAAALAGVLILGPRAGKYNKNGVPKPIQGSNAAQVALGTLILWMGWFGFNGGSQLAIDGIENAHAVAKIFVNTNTAAAAGLIAAMILSKLWLGKTALNAATNGALAGLVVAARSLLLAESR